LARLGTPELQDLVAKFVAVRVVQLKGVDLRRWQFDWDQTWTVVFAHADGTVYGRYGSRAAPRKQAAKDVTLPGLVKAMEGALELHAGYPGNRAVLAGKSVPDSPTARIEDFPVHAARFREALPRGCAHCHFAWDGLRDLARAGGRALPDALLYPYPMPRVLGLELDPAARATVASVAPGTPAAEAGLRAGDRLLEMEGQPLLSVADVQWVLHHAADDARVRVELVRDGKPAAATLRLAPGWRRHDFTWRESTWPLRPGFRLETPTAEERRGAGLSDDEPALRTSPWVAKGSEGERAGIRPREIVVGLDDGPIPRTEQEFLEILYRERKRGDTVRLVLLRGGRRETVRLAVR
jgi:serine protease Do